MNYEKLWNDLKIELANAKLHHEDNNNQTAKTMESTLLIMRYLENKQKKENEEKE